LRAENGFSCPKPGTIAQYQNGKIEYTGIRGGDPYNCMRIGVTGTKGSFLVNYYAVGNEDYSTVKKAMIVLLSKRAPTVTFTYGPEQPKSVSGYLEIPAERDYFGRRPFVRC
jgi:hypothetical protein